MSSQGVYISNMPQTGGYVVAQHTPQQPMTMCQSVGHVSNGHYTPRAMKAILGMGITQIVMGIFSMIFGSAVIIVTVNGYSFFSLNGFVGTGIWVGIFLIITGSFGVAAAKRNSYGFVVACMVLNIICTLPTLTLLSMSGAAVGIESARTYRCGSYREFDYDCQCYVYKYRNCSDNLTLMALDSLMLIIGLVQFIMTIVCSGVCCGAICCRSQVHNGLSLTSQPQQYIQYQSPVGYQTTVSAAGYAVQYPAAASQQQHTWQPAAGPSSQVPQYASGPQGQGNSTPTNQEKPPAYHATA